MDKRILLLIVFTLFLISCQREQAMTGVPDIRATVESKPETRTSLSVDESGAGTIYWSPSDKIDVFFGTTKACYTSQNTSDAISALFKTNDSVSGTEVSSTNIWGLYPSDSNSSCDGSSVTTTLPAVQYGVPNTFDDDLFLAVAHSGTTDLQFCNVCGGIKFNLAFDDIKKITFRGNNNENLAGTVSVSFEDNLPQATIVSGVKEITLTPKTGTTFTKGADYYFTLLPGTLSAGFTITFTASDGTAGKLDYTDKPVTIKRSVFGRKGNMDVYATFDDDRRANNVIYYTSTDGQVVAPYSSNVFGAKIVSNDYVGGRGVLTFDGDVTRIGAQAFYNCSRLKTIELPPSVSSVQANAFNNCTGLDSVTIYAVTPPALGSNAFGQTNDCPIYVVKESLDAYRTGWSEYAGRIYAIGVLYEAVDLGLSVKWATFNVGATKPEEYGDYFAWGETKPKSDYSWSTYKWGDASSGKLTKYNTRGVFGTVDHKTILDIEDDAAHVNWGANWRMPTHAEQQELVDYCYWSWTSNYNGTGVAGMIVRSSKAGYTDKSIFLPASGLGDGANFYNVGSYGYYWSSSLNLGYPSGAWSAFFNSGDYYYSGFLRYYGQFVRPVYGEYIPVKSVSLDSSSLTLHPEDTEELMATAVHENATEKRVHWESSDVTVATVDDNGRVTAVAIGAATITAYGSSGVCASCEVTVQKESVEPEYVDLGLSVKWATFNVGATSPEEYGDYFAWGETEPYYESGYAHSNNPMWKPGKENGYSWAIYKWCNGDYNKLTKYCTPTIWDSTDQCYYWDSANPVDNKTILDPEDDAAHVNWGGSWRMPTSEEQKELLDNCIWTWTTNYNGTGIAGRIVTSNIPGYTDKSIFLPAAGNRYDTSLGLVGSAARYWSASLSTSSPRSAWFVHFSSDYDNNGNGGYRFRGFPIRPVYGEFIPVESISVDKTSLKLQLGATLQLTATINPSNATARDVHWASSNPATAIVDANGLLTALAIGFTTITAYGSSGVSASCMVSVKEITDFNGYEYVDLGLLSGLKWATMNVGATKPEEYGDYFAWGETEPKTDYSWSTYKWCNGSSNTQTKYNTNSSYGTVDNKTVLDPEDDAAHVNWGGSWRMPTAEECDELINNCTWTWTTQNGVNGRLVTGPNGKSIFLPAAGYRYGYGMNRYGAGSSGFCWSSSLSTGSLSDAYDVSFGSDGVDGASYYRYYGFSVRAVTE